jgi:hypothetical protein
MTPQRATRFQPALALPRFATAVDSTPPSPARQRPKDIAAAADLGNGWSDVPMSWCRRLFRIETMRFCGKRPLFCGVIGAGKSKEIESRGLSRGIADPRPMPVN